MRTSATSWIRGGIGGLCETEVENFDGPLDRSLDVLWLEVPVNDSFCVCLLQSLAICRAIERLSSNERDPAARRSASVGPSTSSITSARIPSPSSNPKIKAMLG